MGQAAALQIEMVCLDELVPVEDRLRRIDAAVDWGVVRAGGGAVLLRGSRSAVDCPIVLVKLMLVGALEGIDSMRELLRIAALRRHPGRSTGRLALPIWTIGLSPN